MLALPAQALILDAGGFRLRAYQFRIARAVGFPEGVSAGNQRDRFFVVHGHARECLADVAGRERSGLGSRSALPD